MVLTNSETIVIMKIKDREGNIRNVNVSEDAEYNLMEILKTFNYKMRATCGGMGLCADCHCRIIEGKEQLPEPTFQELETLDFLPDATTDSRLACQITPGNHLNELYIELLGVDYY